MAYCLAGLARRRTLGDLHSSELSQETKSIIESLGCSITMTAAMVGPDRSIDENKNAPKDTDITTAKVDLGWKKCGKEFHDWVPASVKKVTQEISPNLSSVVLGEDDLRTKYTWAEKLRGMIVRSTMIMPQVDSDLFFKDSDEAARFAKDLKLVEGEALPESYNSDFDMQTDESFSRIFFYGIGCVLLTKQEEVSDSDLGPFVVDMPYQDLKTRELYREYGARIHFSKDQKVSGIYDYKHEKLFKPGDDGWDNAKMLAKVTAFLIVTVREHLVWTHVIVSNNATREMSLNLPPDHPIRRLLTVFTFGASEVNIKAMDSLVPELSALHRGTGLDYNAHVAIFDMSYESCNIYEPFSQRTYNSALEQLKNQGKMPYISQGSEYYDIVKSFVKSWLNEAGDWSHDEQAKAFYEAMRLSTKGQKYELPGFDSQDAMENLLTSIIFAVTAYHELVGNVVDYVKMPTRSGFRLTKEDPSTIDIQAYIIGGIIGASTSVRMPQLFSNFTNFFGKGGAPSWEIDVWAKFQEDLAAQSEKVKMEDEERDVKFNYFDPMKFECSVSV